MLSALLSQKSTSSLILWCAGRFILIFIANILFLAYFRPFKRISKWLVALPLHQCLEDVIKITYSVLERELLFFVRNLIEKKCVAHSLSYGWVEQKAFTVFSFSISSATKSLRIGSWFSLHLNLSILECIPDSSWVVLSHNCIDVLCVCVQDYLH